MLLRALNLLYNIVQMTKICKFNDITTGTSITQWITSLKVQINVSSIYHQILGRALSDHGFSDHLPQI